MAQIYSFYGKDIFDPGVYSKVVTVGNANPNPSGVNALMIIAEGINGPAFGEYVAATNVSEVQKVFGDQGPVVEAAYGAFNPSPSLSPAQDVRFFNPRALVQATGIIKTTALGGVSAITLGSKIYGPAGNGIKVSLASKLATVTFPWSPDTYTKTIDNPIMTITMASGFVTITATTISVGLTGALVDYKFSDYPKLIDLINAIENGDDTITIVKDVTTSDNQSTLGLFDHLVGENAITAGLILKADLKQLYDFLDKEIVDVDATLAATATVMVEDFEFYLAGGTSGVDPDATQWGKVYDELEKQFLAVTCPIADGIPAPYDATLTAAIMVLDEQHAVKMNQPDKRGKRRQSFISAHGGYGWNGGFIAKPSDADAIVTISNTHDSEYSQFFGDGLDAINQQGIERSQLPCYFAVRAASMFLGGLASRVLTNQTVTAIKASTSYSEADRKKLHQASVIFAITDTTTRIRQFFTTKKSSIEPMMTVPSRVRCAMLSDNDIARKLESWMSGFQQSGVAPFNAEGKTYIRRVLESQANKSVYWVTDWGDIEFSTSGITFDYTVHNLVVPAIPEFGFGTTEFLNT